MCCSPWGFKELDTTEHVNNNFLKRVNKTSVIVPRNPFGHLPAGRGRELRVKAAGLVQPQYHFPFAAIYLYITSREEAVFDINNRKC